ncbi:MAG: type II toxin-antitoxin system RelE/ParE family toxin [Clostridia bacterium]|nr:type II toxin-antitoxin system RelE/ParE family toxin [Clostridia bacterium]
MTMLKKDAEKIFHRIEMLAENPRPSVCEKLTGEERYRIRQGRYRIVYSIQDKQLTVWIVKVGHRKKFTNKANQPLKPIGHKGASGWSYC